MGNPHASFSITAHPTSLSALITEKTGQYVFSAGGIDSTVHMWKVDLDALTRQWMLNGQDGAEEWESLVPGGREGTWRKEMEDFVFYTGLREYVPIDCEVS